MLRFKLEVKNEETRWRWMGKIVRDRMNALSK